MKKFFAKLAAYSLAIIATILVGFFVVQAFAPVTGGLIGCIRVKNQILQNTPSPRIIIAAGSSAPYCFISSDITKAFNMPCVNMGATAYLGAKFYLSVIEPEIKKGDIIILAFEFNIYDGSFLSEIVWNAVENDISLIKKLPLSYIPRLITGYFPYATNKLTTHYKRPELIEADEKSYTDFGFSQAGDITKPRELILEKGYNTQDLHTINEDAIDKSVTKAMKDFAAKAKQKGATVYIAPSPINAMSLQNGTDMVAFQSRLLDETGIPILGNMENGVMKSEYFYDSNFHLNSKGAQAYTKDFINELTNMINE